MGLFDSLEKGHYGMAFLWLILYFVAVSIVLGVVGFGMGWFGNLGNTAMKEASPSALLEKYRGFLADQNALESIQHNIDVTQAQIKNLEAQYPGKTRAEWSRDDRDQWNDLSNSVTAQKLNFNRIARDYNTRMKDFSYRFTNVGDLPTGATVVLHREFVLYQDV